MTDEPPPGRRALICGISGQDGTYLTQLLLAKGYSLWGTSRGKGDARTILRARGIGGDVDVLTLDLTDFDAVTAALAAIRPHEVYNLSGQSSVGYSFDAPLETMHSIATATWNLLESIRRLDPSIRFFNAGSGECFGDAGANVVTEESPLRPRSPYAVAKTAAAHQVAVYRESYGLFASTGILFNHESPLRPERFVTMKVVAAARRIAHGSPETLRLGNIDIRRDWGWAPEYVDAMWRIVQHSEPDDFIVATGVSESLQDFVNAIFTEFGLSWKDHVVSDPSLLRPFDPLEVSVRPEKIAAVLGWRATFAGTAVARQLVAEQAIEAASHTKGNARVST